MVVTCGTGTAKTLDLITGSCVVCVRTETHLTGHASSTMGRIICWRGRTPFLNGERREYLVQVLPSCRRGWYAVQAVHDGVIALKEGSHLRYNCRRECARTGLLTTALKAGSVGSFSGWNCASNGQPGLLSFLSVVERVLPEWPE